MEIKIIKDDFLRNFAFIQKLGYTSIDIYENSNDYNLGIVLVNPDINQKISFAYYKKSPLTKNNLNKYAILLKLYKGHEHIDFGRVLIKDKRFSKYCFYQYFILSNEYFINDFLELLSQVLNLEYKNLLTGEKWIQVKYDLRDDY